MAGRSGSVFSVILAVILACVSFLHADWGAWIEGGVPAGSPFALREASETSNQQHRTPMMPDGAGGVIVTWVDVKNGCASCPADIYAQRIDAAGNVLWQSGGIIVNATEETSKQSCIVPAEPGKAIVVWLDDLRRLHPVAQKIDTSGAVYWNSAGVDLTNDYSDYQGLHAISDGANGMIVSCRAPDSVLMQRVGPDGSVLWDSLGIYLDVNTVRDHDDNIPTIATDGAHGAIVVWVDIREGELYPSNLDIYAQRVDSSGAELWDSAGVALCNALGDQDRLVILEDGAGGAFAAWEDKRPGGFRLYAQRIDTDGNILWQLNGSPVVTAGSPIPYDPVIAPDGAGGIVLAWRDRRDDGDPGETYDHDVYAQRMDADGNILWGDEGVKVCTQDTIQWDPAICSDGDGGAIVVWTDWRDAEGHIYAQRIDSNGNVKWQKDGIPVCTAHPGCCAPYIIHDGGTGAFISWYAGPEGEDPRCYVQRIDSYFGFSAPACSLALDIDGEAPGGKDFLNGCPGGDWESLGLTLLFDPAGVPRDIEAFEVTLVRPASVATFWNGGPICADSAATLGDTVRTTITHGRFSRNHPFRSDIDSAAVDVVFGGETVIAGDALVVKSADYTGDGSVNLSDLAFFGETYGTWAGLEDYDEWLDFTGNDSIDCNDLGMLCTHYCHHYDPGQILRLELDEESDVRLRVVVSGPADCGNEGGGAVTAAVYIENAGDASLVCLGLDFDDERLQFTGWNRNPETAARTFAARVERRNNTRIFLVSFGLDSGRDGRVALGELMFSPVSAPAGSLAEMGFDLVIGDVLCANGRARRIGDVSITLEGVKENAPRYVNQLSDNYPNPFNPTTTIEYSIGERSVVNLSIFDVNGRLVRMLVNEAKPAGSHRFVWDGRDGIGSLITSGVYFYRLKTGTFSRTKKLVVLR